MAQEYVPDDDTETRNAFRRHQVQREVAATDIVYGMGFLTVRERTVTDSPLDDDDDYDSESEEEE